MDSEIESHSSKTTYHFDTIALKVGTDTMYFRLANFKKQCKSIFTALLVFCDSIHIDPLQIYTLISQIQIMIQIWNIRVEHHDYIELPFLAFMVLINV